MNQNLGRNISLALFALVAMLVGNVRQTGAIAPGTTTSDWQIAQNLGNLCQQVANPQGLAVHQRPSPNSPVIGNLIFNQQVTLADAFRNIRGPGGETWTEITFPTRGYVARGFPGNETALMNCSGLPPTTPPPTTTNPGDLSRNPLCRQIDRRAAPQGVVVRANASRTSARMGGVATGNQVLLVPNYQSIPDLNGENRQWVQITAPLSGFISTSTLIRCR
jgi:hypothetical protein